MTFFTLVTITLILALSFITYITVTSFTQSQLDQFISTYRSIQTNLQAEVKYYVIEMRKGMAL